MNLFKNLIILLFGFSFCSLATESAFKCSEPKCVKDAAESIIDTNDVERVDLVIKQVDNLKDDVMWKKNMLGALYLIKKDPESIRLSEKHLHEAYKEGSKSAIHNLAELYFFKEDFDKSMYYLDLEREFNYKYPSVQYVDWTRLYAQHMYFGLPEIENKEEAIRLFKEICSLDTTGTTDYFLALDLLEKKNIKDAQFYLHNSIEAKNLNAILLYGDLYFEGRALDKDWKQAKNYYLKASGMNSDRAHMNLAVIFKSEQNAEKMKFHLTEAAKLGNAQARALFNKLKGK
ncbi:hypothetical protein HWQ46_26440 [Shewanella sp. D64]|uniref:tetratricopeptide repeat protein n=1 Tax=unclassified Shewanella TaxID=196818 RepID=UPI0022BA2E96|nr:MULTISPECIES: hypothetical protein [unclassified Shewanella]MEC4729056.1 hypothetical protein [Shewanella sp. D64]MEC4737885.1 hypothetical protein [Shewanella sp. E94]WBJ93862.1 hypothetical protein HWQ47_18275 [Shewanella sp. MTB7]